MEKRDPAVIAAEMAMIPTLPAGAPHRRISQAVAELFGVRYSVASDTGDPRSVYYPYYENGRITDYKIRHLPKQFATLTGKIARAELFGQHLIDQRRGLLIITEGEDDCMAALDMLWAEGKSYHVVSLQNGANEDGKLDKALLRQLEFIQGFSKVAICLDNDQPGQATALALADAIAAQCDVRLMHLPEGYNDVYDLWREGHSAWFLEMLNRAEQYRPEGVIEGTEVQLKVLQEPVSVGFELPWPQLQHRTKGLRKGEITLLTAGTGIGKTTMAREIAYHMVTQHGCKVGMIMLEEQYQKTAQGFVALDNNIPLPLLRTQPDRLSQERWEASHAKLFASGKVSLFNHFGSVESDILLRKMRYQALALECDFIFLDHITMVMSGQDTRDERKDIDILMTRLAELVTETGVGVVGVVHLRRTLNKSYNKGDEVELTDLRGSSQLEALSFNIWALERDQQGDSKDVLTIRNLKNREWGFTGLCDRLVYNHSTGRLQGPGVKL